jgi:hypothetical protein
MSARIEGWQWSDGLAASPVFLQEITVTEAGGAPVTVRLPLPLHFSQALSVFAIYLTVQPATAGIYSFTYANNRVTLACLGPASFDVSFGGALGRAWGFGLATTGSNSYTANNPPLLACPLVGVDCEIADSIADEELREFRHGRHSALYFSTCQIFRVGLVFEAENSGAVLDGYCSAGRVRVYLGDDANVYSELNIDGYVEGWVLACSETETLDRAETLLRVNLLVAVGVR